VGEANAVRRYSSRSTPEMMQLYAAVLDDIKLSHEELRRQFQLLDVYVELRRLQ